MPRIIIEFIKHVAADNTLIEISPMYFQAMRNDNVADVDADSNGEGNAVNLTLRSELPPDQTHLLYSLTIRPADIPPPQEESDEYYYMDQEPNEVDTDSERSQENKDKTREVKESQLSSASNTSAYYLSLAQLLVTFFLTQRVYL